MDFVDAQWMGLQVHVLLKRRYLTRSYFLLSIEKKQKASAWPKLSVGTTNLKGRNLPCKCLLFFYRSTEQFIGVLVCEMPKVTIKKEQSRETTNGMYFKYSFKANCH